MKLFTLLMAAAFMFSTLPALAQDLVPATSEDMSQFDKQIAETQRPEISAQDPAKEKKAKKENFGQLVSAEAKRLKDADGDKRKQFGKWVSDQRRKNDEIGGKESGSDQVGGSDGSSSASHGASDAHRSAPGAVGKDKGNSSPHGNSGGGGKKK